MPSQFNNSLLFLARQYRDQSQAEVAEGSGLNQGHYSRIENGLLPDGPSEENVEKIALQLSFPSSFFYLPDDIAGLPLSVHPMHRKKASVGERVLRCVHAELNIRLMHIRRFLSAVDIEAELPLPWMDVDDSGGPVSIARELRLAWNIPEGPIYNLTEYCERAGILVVWCDFEAPIDGVTMRMRDIPPCIFLNRRSPADRMRFSLAHELGHIIMHRIPTDTIEEEANSFAAELLVPEKLYKRQLIGRRLTLEVLARQKAYWKTSMNFLLLHATRIGFINKNQSEYLWKQMSFRGWRTHEPDETSFEHEHPTLFPKIIDLYASDLEYAVEDFTKLLHVDKVDVHKLYGSNIKPDRSRLYVVK